MTALLDQTSWSCRVHPRLVLCRVVERKLWLSCLDGHVERHNLQKVLWVAGQEIMAHIWEVSMVELIYVLKGHILHLTLEGALHSNGKAMLRHKTFTIRSTAQHSTAQHSTAYHSTAQAYNCVICHIMAKS